MRVMFLNPTGQLGGAESSLVDILASLRQAEPSWPLHLLAASDGPLIGRARSLGVTAEVLPFPSAIARLGEHGAASGGPGAAVRFAAQIALASAAAVRYRAALGRAIDAFDPAIVHTNGLKMHVLAAWGRRRPEPAPTVWPRVASSRLPGLAADDDEAPALATMGSGSSGAARHRRRQFGRALPPMRHSRWPTAPVWSRSGTEWTSIAFRAIGARANLDAMSGLPQAPANTVRVGLVATLARWKGHATFLEAIARLPARLAVRAYIVGDAVYQTEGSQYSLDELRQLARRSGVADRVGFTGLRSIRLRPSSARSMSSSTRAPRQSPLGSSSPRRWRAAAP